MLAAVSLFEPDENGDYTALRVVAPPSDPAQGVLAAAQTGPAGGMVLNAELCPAVSDVCGFRPGSTALIVDGLGHHDVFQVVTTVPATRLLTPSRALSQSYPAASVVVEVDEFTFALSRQPDDSYSLIRQTAAGAIQPVADFVRGLAFRGAGQDAPGGFFQYREIEVTVSVEAQTRSLRRVIPDRVFHTSIKLRNAP
jgi:hypothetical protein